MNQIPLLGSFVPLQSDTVSEDVSVLISGFSFSNKNSTTKGIRLSVSGRSSESMWLKSDQDISRHEHI